MTEWSVSYNTSNATYTSSRSFTSSGFSPYAYPGLETCGWSVSSIGSSSTSTSSPAPPSSSPGPSSSFLFPPRWYAFDAVSSAPFVTPLFAALMNDLRYPNGTYVLSTVCHSTSSPSKTHRSTVSRRLNSRFITEYPRGPKSKLFLVK